MVHTREEEWLWGWDPTPGIVSVWAEPDGRAFVWRRLPGGGALVREDVRFRPWLLLASLDDLTHLGERLRPEREGPAPQRVSYEELEGPGALRYLVRAEDGRALTAAVLQGAARRLGRPVGHVRELGEDAVLALPPEEQYLVASGRTYFRELGFDDLRRMQVDLETTGLSPERDRIFLVALRAPDGATETLEATGEDDAAEADLLRRLVARVRALDPDVIENHNLHGFDLPFLAHRARRLGVPLALGRAGSPGLRQRPAARGAALGQGASRDAMRRILWTVPEPVSKGLAAVMTATLIVYLGVDTFWSLIEGFKQLVERADRATTFDELRAAGERYGKVMGRNAARAFALLATVAIGNTAQGFAATVPTLPGSALAASQAGAHSGIRLSAVGHVETVAVTGQAITFELAPGAVAMAVNTTGSAAGAGHNHHIATDKWWIAPHGGGPWSPEFQKIFDKAGMSLDDPANIVHVKGHKGPHPQEYHEKVYQRLLRATSRCRTMAQCREALTAELRRLARDIATEGTELNKLVTRTE